MTEKCEACPTCKRKYFLQLGELLDRLSILELKSGNIPENREKYAQEIDEICNDIQVILNKEKVVFTSQMLRALIVLGQINAKIWQGEANFRKGIKEGNNLELTHGLNGIRNMAKNKIQEATGGRKDLKVDCVEVAKNWVPTGW